MEEILQQMTEIFKKTINEYEELETCYIWDRSGCIDRDIKNLKKEVKETKGKWNRLMNELKRSMDDTKTR